MRLLDSNIHKKWFGTGFEILEHKIVINKAGYLTQNLKQGTFDRLILRVIGKKRSGNGLLVVRVKSKNNVVINKTIVFSSKQLSEKILSTDTSELDDSVIEIFRPNKAIGRVELGRVVVEAYRETISPKTNTENVSREFFEPIGSEKLDIAFIVPYGIYGGAEVYLRNYINSINSDIFDVTFLFMKKNELINDLDDHVNSIFLNSRNALLSNITSREYDAICFYNSKAIYNVLKYAKEGNLNESKIIEIFHSALVWPDSMTLEKDRGGVDAMIKVSNSLDSVTNDISKTSIVYPSINTSKYNIRDKKAIKESLRIDSSKSVIGCVARLSPEKNIDYLLELSKIMKNYKFIIVGDGPQRAKIQNIIMLNELNVNIIGYVKDPYLYYNCMDAFVLPSKVEGMPLSMIEAMSSGVPVFVSDVGAITDIIEHNYNGFILSKNIKLDSKLICDNIDNYDVINAARDTALDKFSIDHNIELFEQALISSLSDYSINYEQKAMLEGFYL